MNFIKTKINGLYEIELKNFNDLRGSFTRLFCYKEFMIQGINFRVNQINLSKNKKKKYT